MRGTQPTPPVWRSTIATSSKHPSVGDPVTNAKVSEKMRGAGGDRHGSQHNGNRQPEGQRGDQRGEGAFVVGHAFVACRHREAEFGRSSEHGPSFSIQPSPVPFPKLPYGWELWRSC